MAANTKGSRKPASKKQDTAPSRKSLESANKKAQQTNIHQNTHNQGYQQDR